jgi:hypothetical protein
MSVSCIFHPFLVMYILCVYYILSHGKHIACFIHACARSLATHLSRRRFIFLPGRRCATVSNHSLSPPDTIIIVSLATHTQNNNRTSPLPTSRVSFLSRRAGRPAVPRLLSGHLAAIQTLPLPLVRSAYTTLLTPLLLMPIPAATSFPITSTSTSLSALHTYSSSRAQAILTSLPTFAPHETTARSLSLPDYTADITRRLRRPTRRLHRGYRPLGMDYKRRVT